LAITGGSTFGVTDDDGPGEHPLPGPSAFGQAIAAGKSAARCASMHGPQHQLSFQR